MFVAGAREASHVSERIAAALRGGAGWRVVSIRERPVAASERVLADRLLAGPRAAR